MNTGLFVGRFQPFHNGHMKAIEYSIERSDRLIVCVGSAQKNHEADNPFTAGERIEMVWRVLAHGNLKKPVLITAVDDVQNHELWLAHLESYLPQFNDVFSNDPMTELLVRESSHKIINVPLVDREELMATVIRSKMAKGERWKQLVPTAVYDYLVNEIDGENRVKFLLTQVNHNPLK
ncbi:MAG: nicotinamide-nucleotide adenylyltransferase [Nitrososphaerota archaeon]|nr:nicotinamide-nucleotide adenylyltransferase [Nitrososphaerota archaeon]MDG7047703.1 nicotinamide-nucleotide adenylyltransferase [Nitrososphaerota archaeon]MDG7048683.1 nicotinamide-nucleotide adenylyltransferase [Nitrososphaerota archaeon]MDG7050907.1 nicotinamide-nucleotide adenylyltransferase [Nitrososphaerota archaeon]